MWLDYQMRNHKYKRYCRINVSFDTLKCCFCGTTETNLIVLIYYSRIFFSTVNLTLLLLFINSSFKLRIYCDCNTPITS